MKFHSLDLKGLLKIEPEVFTDMRGQFYRTFCAENFQKMGIRFNLVQTNFSYTQKKNTFRGLHYQVNGYEEAKLIKCIKGNIFDVVVDLRKDSKTFLKHSINILDSGQNHLLYVPEGFAHGFLTLTDHVEIMYQVSNYYSQQNERGIRWNDPLLHINWSTDDMLISDKDKSYPDYKIL